MSVAKKTLTGPPHAFSTRQASRPRILRIGRNRLAFCATCSTRRKRRQGTRGSVSYLFGELVPADAVTDVVPQLPLDRLRGVVGQLEQPLALRDRVEGVAGRDQVRLLREQRGQLGEVAGDGPPPAPVGAQQLAEVVGVQADPFPAPIPAERQSRQQVDDVARVLLVE